MAILKFAALFWLVTLCTALPNLDYPENVKRQAATKYLFVFGDSYSATGFDINGQQPGPANPQGNPAFGTGTSAGSLNYVNYLTVRFNNSLTYAFDLARGGAVADNTIINPSQQTPSGNADLAGETFLFDGLRSQGKINNWNGDNSLFIIWFGVNDVFNSYTNRADYEAKYPQVMATYIRRIQHFIDLGAKNFAILRVPPITRTPLVTGFPADNKANLTTALAFWDTTLKSNVVDNLNSRPNIRAYLIDTATPFNQVLDNPADYGFPDNTCTNSNGYSCPWWDAFHPGTWIQAGVARSLATQIPSFFTV